MIKPPRISGGLYCPYDNCGKPFDKPMVLTDTTHILRETYYACPHCQSKLDVTVDMSNARKISVAATHAPVISAPENCKHHLGYLSLLDESAEIPDECAVCPKVMRCSAKKSLNMQM
jgi:DNA-directed RNA polymerase subunit RPC12/RpoP